MATVEHDPTEGPMTLERAQAMMETALGAKAVTVSPGRSPTHLDQFLM